MTKKITILIGLAFFSTQLLFSIIYYKERIIFLDGAYHIFYFSKDGVFNLLDRVAAFFIQLIPLIAVKAGLSLDKVVLAYSISFVLESAIVFFLLIITFKNIKLSLAFLLFCSLITTHIFYWPATTLPHGIYFSFIYFAILEMNLTRNNIHPSLITYSVIFLFFICFSHPLVIFSFIFFLLYYYYLFPAHKTLLIQIGISFLILFISKSIFFYSVYDKEAASGLKNIIRLFPDYFTMISNKNFLKYLIHDYYFLIPAIFTIVCFLILKKFYKTLLVYLILFFGYTFMVNVNYANGSYQFYIENQYLQLALMAALPLPFVLTQWNKKYILIIATCVVCIVCLYRIQNAHSFYTNRLNWMRKTLDKVENSANKKVIFNSSLAPKDTVLMTWASSFEFWLLSTIESGKSASIIFVENPDQYKEDTVKESILITKGGSYEYSQLNKKYFIFTDSSKYVIVK